MDGVTDLDGDETVFLYDAASQPTALLAPDATPSDLDDNPRRTLDYDAAGRLTDVGVETGGAVGLVYADAGRVVGVSDVAGPATRSVLGRSEARRVGKRCVSTCRSRWARLP